MDKLANKLGYEYIVYISIFFDKNTYEFGISLYNKRLDIVWEY